MDWAGVLLEIGIDIPLEKSEIQTLCPFHSDTRDSCSINVDKGVWICFRGCGQGSLRGFIKRILNLSWKEVDAYLVMRYKGNIVVSFDGKVDAGGKEITAFLD